MNFPTIRILIAILLLTGCQESDSTKNRGQGQSGVVVPNNVSPDSLAISVVNELDSNLQNKTALSKEQANVISNNAAGSLAINTGGNLNGEGKIENYENKIEEFADDLVKGALSGLNKITVIHQRQVNQILKEIIASIVGSLAGRTGHLETENLLKMLFEISKGAVISLDEAGYDIKELAEGVRVIVSEAIGSLDDAALLTPENSFEVIKSIIKGSVQGLTDSPLGSSTNRIVDYSFVIDDLMYGAVGALDDAGFAIENIDDLLEHIFFATVSSIDELGFKPAELEMILEQAIQGAMDALKREAGISDPAQIETSLGFMVRGSVEALPHAGLSIEEMDEVLYVIVRKMVEHFDNLGISDNEIEAVVEKILINAVAGLKNAGFSFQHTAEYGDVMGDMVVAVVEGLLEAGQTNGQAELLLDDAVDAIFSPLKSQAFSKEQGTIIGGHFKTSLKAGLASSKVVGFTYSDTVLNTHIQSAIDKAFL